MTESVDLVFALLEEEGGVLRDAPYAYPYMRTKAIFFGYSVRSPQSVMNSIASHC